MKVKNLILAVLFLFLTVSFYYGLTGGRLQGTSQQKDQEKKQEKSEIKSLIRKDLLLRERKKLEPPKRNIFAPGQIPIEETEFEAEERKQKLPGLEAEPEAETESEVALSYLAIKYIGYVFSDQKIVGLIIFNGEPMAVEEGELISEDVKVGKITTEEIEIIGPNSRQRKYSLEEEKP